ncbi:hypothetical protein [Micromonospora parathelypteridis]|uniref:Uncharacterized protein n=1 Tax=Micromonospora parathelypteridis TaxID=1839617 RepID=A0A840W416_9ACTN|nr:hypothetical protein [Micromonospora parathelypteridis]MBB5479520.1 hypothetical protein [Micromonospora parathelypteridis]GGO30367.1 hypothetical protein GCM10011576_57810 [Micromonospora parathelypteridis]
MRRFGGKAAAKALILAAIPIGGVGIFVAEPWAVASIAANLVLLAGAGGLWWLAVRRDRRWHHLHRSCEPGGAAAKGDGGGPGALADYDDPDALVFASRSVPRHRLMVSSTSRIRRAGMGHSISRIERLADSAQRQSRREQLWWLVAGLAASIPIGVAINLVTG